jgi:hypothetical protein
MHMSNRLAIKVSDNITGEESRIVSMCGKFYRMGCPTPFVLGRLLKPLSRLEVEEGDDKSALIRKSVEQYGYMDEVIALAILGDVKMTPVARFRLHLMMRRFRRANDVERLTAFKEMLSLVTPDSFFAFARLAMKLTGRLANTKPSEDGR